MKRRDVATAPTTTSPHSMRRSGTTGGTSAYQGNTVLRCDAARQIKHIVFGHEMPNYRPCASVASADQGNV